jgi:hypothetical protein
MHQNHPSSRHLQSVPSRCGVRGVRDGGRRSRVRWAVYRWWRERLPRVGMGSFWFEGKPLGCRRREGRRLGQGCARRRDDGCSCPCQGFSNAADTLKDRRSSFDDIVFVLYGTQDKQVSEILNASNGTKHYTPLTIVSESLLFTFLLQSPGCLCILCASNATSESSVDSALVDADEVKLKSPPRPRQARRLSSHSHSSLQTTTKKQHTRSSP